MYKVPVNIMFADYCKAALLVDSNDVVIVFQFEVSEF